MPEQSRWLSFCRRLAPADLRERAFDPAVHDLLQARALHAGGVRAAAGARLRLALSILAIALECRRVGWTTRTSRLDITRGSHGDNMAITLLQTIRLAMRRLRHEPMFALVAVATLALGIGANVAVFSFVNAYLVAPLPVPAASELIRVYGRTGDSSYDVVSYPNYKDVRDGVPGLDLAAHGFARALVGTGDAVEARPMEVVTGNYFAMLRLRPALGRLIEPRDDGAEGSGPVVVLSESLWRTSYASDRAILGRTIRLNGTPFEVIGVAPSGFRGTEGASIVDLWAPIAMQQTLRPRGLSIERRTWGWLRTIGRVSP